MNFIYRKATKEEIERYEINSQQYGKSTVKKMLSNKQEFVKAISPYLNMYNEEWIYSPDDISYMENIVRNKQMKFVGVYKNEEIHFINFLIDNEIAPETALNDDYNCSIGFSSKTNKWYGWSDRAIHGFGIGHTVKKGDLGYIPDNIEELSLQTLSQYGNDDKEYTRITKFDNYITVEISYCVITGLTKEGDYVYDICWSKPDKRYPGKGEWTAKTLEDCKQMAIDFAIAVR